MSKTRKNDRKRSATAKRFAIASVLSIAVGAGAFSAVHFFPKSRAFIAAAVGDETTSETSKARSAYVALDTLVVSLPRSQPPRHLRFEATLQVPFDVRPQVEASMPRLIDITNTYLRATDLTDLDTPASLILIKAHLLHRYRVALEPAVIEDVLITNFLIS